MTFMHLTLLARVTYNKYIQPCVYNPEIAEIMQVHQPKITQ